MNITNVHDLPAALVRAVTNDPYRSGGDISVTKLIDSPQVRHLQKKFGAAVVEDVSERLFSLLGQGVHTVLERAGDEAHVKMEERLYADVNGWRVSGQFDRMDLSGTTLDDYKVTSVWSVKGKIEWERQLNCLRWLAHQNGYQVDRLRIIAILRDWKKTEAKIKPDYPQAPVVVIPVQVWDLSETYQYILDRVALHQSADAGDVPPCTPEERWYSGTKWALKKPGGKRAIRLYERKEDAEPIPDGTVLEERPGAYRRCDDYCAVSEFCEQYRSDRQEVPTADWELGDGS